MLMSKSHVTHRNVVDVVGPAARRVQRRNGVAFACVPSRLGANARRPANPRRGVLARRRVLASNDHPKMKWLTLDEARELDQSLHDTAAVALAACTSMQAHRWEQRARNNHPPQLSPSPSPVPSLWRDQTTVHRELRRDPNNGPRRVVWWLGPANSNGSQYNFAEKTQHNYAHDHADLAT